MKIWRTIRAFLEWRRAELLYRCDYGTHTHKGRAVMFTPLRIEGIAEANVALTPGQRVEVRIFGKPT